MFAESNYKLRQVRNLLVDLIAEVDVALEEVQAARRATPALDGDGEGGESESLGEILRQREVLISVAIMLADVRLEWRGERQYIEDGRA
jgi:hypothetical protein